MRITAKTIFSGLVLAATAGAEEKDVYETTPPKDYSTISTSSFGPKVTANLDPLAAFNEQLIKDDEIVLFPSVEEAEVGAEADGPDYSCPSMEPLWDSGTNPNFIRIRANDIVVRHGEDPRRIRWIEVIGVSSVETGEIVRWYVVILDSKLCPYHLEQPDQTAALRLVETLQAASFDQNQELTIELLSCTTQPGTRSCEARFRGLSWRTF